MRQLIPSTGRCTRSASLAALTLLMLCYAACSQDVSGKPQNTAPTRKMAVSVTVAEAVRKTAPVELRAIGTVQPFASVAVKSQVDGELTGVHFQEGQEVKAGDLLFSIDPRPYQTQLKQAQASLARNRAQLNNARKSAERYGSVVGKGFVAEEQFDQITASAAALEASVQADEAAVEMAQLKLSFCTIRAPIPGVAGGLKIHRGNLIKANDSERPLVVIHQIHPVYVAFSVPERNLTEIQRFMARRRLAVAVTRQGDPEPPEKGELAFIENAVDTSTGSIALKAVFKNLQNRLWPGQFVLATLTLTHEADAIVIPTQAIQEGQHGAFVFVVNADQTVTHRPVTVKRTLDGEAVIAAGVTAGETVVTDGHLRLTTGTLVKVVAPAAPQKPAGGGQG